MKATFLGVKNHEEYEYSFKKIFTPRKTLWNWKNSISKGFSSSRNFFNAGFVFLVGLPKCQFVSKVSKNDVSKLTQCQKCQWKSVKIDTGVNFDTKSVKGVNVDTLVSTLTPWCQSWHHGVNVDTLVSILTPWCQLWHLDVFYCSERQMLRKCWKTCYNGVFHTGKPSKTSFH